MKHFLRSICLFSMAAVFLFGSGALLYASKHIPPASSGAVEMENHLRFFIRSGKWNPMISFDWRFEEESFTFGYHALTAGAYYRLHPNIKAGLFYRAGRGLRHDDDWIADGLDFIWQDTSDRLEQILIGDITPRFRMSFLPGRAGERLLFQLKNRYHFNTFNSHQVLLVRPALTWFHIVDREPLFNIQAAWAGYWSLNFGETLLYESYPYLTFLYHLSAQVKLETGIKLRTTTWSTSQDVIDDPAHGNYTKSYRPVVVRAGVILYLDR